MGFYHQCGIEEKLGLFMGGDLNVYEGVFLFKSRGNKYKIEYSRSLGRANKSYHKDSKYRDRLV